jgi:hypothetical protein
VREATSPARRLGKGLVTGVLLILGLFLVVRSMVEIITLNPTRPDSYRHDWGGPHYLGVLLVHAGPGALALAVALASVRRRRSS